MALACLVPAFLSFAQGTSAPVPKDVPDLLTAFDGTHVADAAIWERVRRPELRKIFLEKMYGVRPDAAERPDVRFEPAGPDCSTMGGRAIRKRIRAVYAGPYGTNSFVFTAFIPISSRPSAAFVLICNRDPAKNIDPDRTVRTDFWPAERIVERGYAAIAFFNGDIARETGNPATAFLNGVFPCYERPEERTDRSWGVLSAWAWGASRVMDWIATEPTLDKRRVAVVGHSRGGKTALLAAVTDERFAMACVNDSGCGGAKLARIDLPLSEHYAAFLRSRKTYWFCGEFQNSFMGLDGDVSPYDVRRGCRLPDIDQHELVALVAPRLVAIGSAQDDISAGPLGEFYSARLASPVWELYGRKGLPPGGFPAPDTSMRGGDVTYHLRSGGHDLKLADWDAYMDFAADHGWQGD